MTLGLITIPLLLAKLWSVIPKLFQWPAIRNAANAIERLSLLLLVGGALFEFATGVLNIQYYYAWHYNFVTAHYWGAWVFFAAFVVHVCVKMPVVIRSYRARGVLKPLREDLAHTRPEPTSDLTGEDDGLVPVAPGAPTISRRGLLGLVGGASLTILVVQAGESIGGPLRRLALLAPRGRVFGTGPNDFQVNRTVASAGIPAELIGPAWRLHVPGRHPEARALSRAADGDAAVHARAADRLRRGVVDDAALARRADLRPGRAGRRAAGDDGQGRVGAARAACSAARRSRASRSATAARCSRCASTASTSRPTTATRRGSSPPVCLAFTAPSGSAA